MIGRRFRLARLGMTLVETAIALTLASLVLAALVGFLPVLEQIRTSTQPTGTNAWRASTIQAIENDLIAARQIAFEDNSLLMTGHQLEQRSNVHAIGEVSYRLLPSAHRDWSWLVREQSSVTGKSQQVICGNIADWSLKRMDRAGDLQPIPSQLGPAPEKMQIRLHIRLNNKEFEERWYFMAN